jgi:hypothetical protein
MNVALLVLNTASLNSGETLVRDTLVTRGHSVSLYALASSSPSTVGSPDVVVATPGTATIANATAWRDTTRPIVSLGGSFFNAIAMGGTNSNGSSATTWYLSNSAHAIADGRAVGNYTVLTGATFIRYVELAAIAPGGVVMALATSGSTRVTYFYVETGANLTGPIPAPARRVAMMTNTTLLPFVGPIFFDFLVASMNWVTGALATPTGLWLATASGLQILTPMVAR